MRRSEHPEANTEPIRRDGLALPVRFTKGGGSHRINPSSGPCSDAWGDIDRTRREIAFPQEVSEDE